MFLLFLTIIVPNILVNSQKATDKRPFYVIGHMANSIEEVTPFLDSGANALESDIFFYRNGTVHEIYHGIPCDCLRICTRRARLSDYLSYLRQITDPTTGKYANKLIYQFFDLKLTNVEDSNKLQAGQTMADHILDYLWGEDKNRTLIKALVYINHVSDRQVIVGIRERFQDRGFHNMLKNIGFDGGVDDLREIKSMWNDIGVKSNIWQGDGNFNCISALYPDSRLREALRIRDSSNSFNDKVYHWTIDSKDRMRLSIELGVDGMITNVPHDLIEVLKEPQFSNTVRLATVQDDPFVKFIPSRKSKYQSLCLV